MMMKKKYLRSQIAAIITFVIAVIILMVIVFINIAKVSDVKTITSQVADKSSLLLASKIGSMSKAYKSMLGAHWFLFPPELRNIDGEDVWYTESLDWVLLAGLLFIAVISGGIATGFLFPFLIPFAMLGFGSGFFGSFVSGVMTKAMQQKFNEQMSGFNGMREAILYNAAAALQTDTGKPFPKVDGSGIFQNPETGETYDLSSVEGMSKEEKVDRFNAWYYKYRWPQVNDESLKTEMNNFINSLRNLTGVVDAGGWDLIKWNIEKATFTIGPGFSPGAQFQVTCAGGSDPYGNPGVCPAWVVAGNKAKIVTIDRDIKMFLSTNYDVTGGFLKQEFTDLLNRLEAIYGLSFCGSLLCWGDSCLWNSCENVQSVMVELSMFLGRNKELLDLPISERLRTITQWFPLYYDQTKHNFDRSSKDGGLEHDYYLRLTKVAETVNEWILELNDLNTGSNDSGQNGGGINIKGEIEAQHGVCKRGYGPGVSSSCYATYACSSSECGEYCCGPCDCECCNMCCYYCCLPSSYVSPCVWQGTYYTCCQNPPVCSNGDLYNTIPPWCPGADHDGCSGSCGCNVGDSFDCSGDSKEFQGMLAWSNTTGPTEVEQALAILRALVDTINEVKQSIANLADKIEELADKDSVVRNGFVYGWQGRTTSDNYYHLLRVRLEAGTQAAPTGYPMKDLPRIIEKKGWFGLTKIQMLKGWKGSFKITASRYDQDMPVMNLGVRGWNLRLRQWPKMPDVPADQLAVMVGAIQSGSTVDYNSFFDTQAINSQAEGFYGIDKNEIYIKRVK